MPRSLRAVEIDRVELNKIWRTDHMLPQEQQKYPGDFAGERLNIERAYRADRAMDIMVEADKIIRSRILQATRPLKKEGELFVLPEDWSSTCPTLEDLAQAVVDGISEQMKATVPLPSVDIRTDSWLNAFDIQTLPGIGSANYRVGQRMLPTYSLPAAFDSEEVKNLITIQPQLPIVDPAAEDSAGNRYYAVIYELNEAGPADSIDDVGRDQVVSDYKSVKAYERLVENLDDFRARATNANDLAPAITAAMDLSEMDIIRPGVARNILVRGSGVSRGALASFVEPGLNDQVFRDAVIEASSGLGELVTPDEVAQSPIIVGVALPASKSIGLARVVAPRPMTMDMYQGAMGQIIGNEAGAQIRDALNTTGTSPFTLDTLSARYGYERVQKRASDQDEPEAETESADS